MMNQLKKTIASFKNAFRGLAVLFKEERNARIHLIATAAVTAAGVYFNLTIVEWCLIIFAIGLVLILEAINTAFENVMNFISEAHDPKI